MTDTAPSKTQITLNDIGGVEEIIAAIDATIVNLKDGQLIEGTVVRVDRDELLIDVGYKTEGIIPSNELGVRKMDPRQVAQVGDRMETIVVTCEDKEGRLILSRKRAIYEKAWVRIEEVRVAGGTIEGPVIEVVKGGLILDVGLRGFLPASLVEMRRVRDLQPYLGQVLEAKILEVDRSRNNVVLSRRAHLETARKESRSDFLTKLVPGQVRKGTVSSIVPFGVFVDLGDGVDGLVHVSELSWKHVTNPGDLVQMGEEVTVQVIEVDMTRERVSLSMKAVQEDPWAIFARTHQLGQVARAKITKLVPFGAFARVADGVEGLIHISELASQHVEDPVQVVTPGDEVFVRVVDIDLDRRRVSLSLKQAGEPGAISDEFDPYLYGMTPSFDAGGNYIGPSGFDPVTGEWREGSEGQRAAWEAEYAAAHERWEDHQAALTVDPDAGRAGEGTLSRNTKLKNLRDALAHNGG